MKDKEIIPMELEMVTPTEVRKIIKSLKSTGAQGSDGISVVVLKKIAETIIPFLTIVINNILTQCVYPDSFKYGIISPVPKGGDPEETKNWRPVTILNSMSKVVERVINQQIKDHLIRNKLISDEQHAYQKGKSTTSAWLELDTLIAQAHTGGQSALLLCMDQ